jgi:hypothetical protein
VEVNHAFGQLEGLETEKSLTHDGFTVRVKVDRMQRNELGELAILDYKGSAKDPLESWLGDRPHEPQLPLYAAIAQSEGKQSGELVFGIYGSPPRRVSISSESALEKLPANNALLAELIGTGVLCPGDWSARLMDNKSPLDQKGIFESARDQFEAVIRNLIEDLQSGSPVLDPLHLPKSTKSGLAVEDYVCKTCDYQDVCRIREWMVGEELEEDSDEGDTAE